MKKKTKQTKLTSNLGKGHMCWKYISWTHLVKLILRYWDYGSQLKKYSSQKSASKVLHTVYTEKILLIVNQLIQNHRFLLLELLCWAAIFFLCSILIHLEREYLLLIKYRLPASHLPTLKKKIGCCKQLKMLYSANRFFQCTCTFMYK